jgi:hypothetical protein
MDGVLWIAQGGRLEASSKAFVSLAGIEQLPCLFQGRFTGSGWPTVHHAWDVGRR